MTETTTLSRAGEGSTPRRRRRLLTVLAAVTAAALAWTILEVGFGFDLHAPAMGGTPGMDIGLGAVMASAAGAGLLAWTSLVVLERWTSRPRPVWTALAGAAFLMSLGGPLGGGGIETLDRWLLLMLHATVAAVLIPGLARTNRRRTEMRRTTLSPAEVAYLTEDRRLGRLATADTHGRPQVTPVGMWRYRDDLGVLDISGRDFAATRKYRNVAVNPRAALVVDDIAPGEGWRPRAVIVEGPAAALEDDGEGGGPMIRITPERVVSWGV